MKNKYIIFDLTTERYYCSSRGDVYWSKNCQDANCFGDKLTAFETATGINYLIDVVLEIKEIYSKK